MPDIDLFHLFRHAVALMCVTYAVVQMIYRLSSMWGYLISEDSRAQMLRSYALTHMLRVRMHRFSWLIFHIVLLSLIVLYLFSLHL